jgi:hypothetical protein
MSYIPYGSDVGKFSTNHVWQQTSEDSAAHPMEGEVWPMATRLPFTVKDNPRRNNGD